jgi:hypothetical protein
MARFCPNRTVKHHDGDHRFDSPMPPNSTRIRWRWLEDLELERLSSDLGHALTQGVWRRRFAYVNCRALVSLTMPQQRDSAGSPRTQGGAVLHTHTYTHTNYGDPPYQPRTRSGSLDTGYAAERYSQPDCVSAAKQPGSPHTQDVGLLIVSHLQDLTKYRQKRFFHRLFKSCFSLNPDLL